MKTRQAATIFQKHEEKLAFTTAEAAKYIAMSESFLRQSRMDGDRVNRTLGPPFIRIGRAVRYLKYDLDAWLELHKAGSYE